MSRLQKIYSTRKSHYRELVKRHKSAVFSMSRLRFTIFILGIIFIMFFYTKKYYYMDLSVFLVSVILFIIAVKTHEKIKRSMIFTEKLQEINQDSLDRAKGEWKRFKDKGEEFKDKNHNYSFDLDLFGENSLFQWINCCNTYVGRESLKNVLIGQIGNKQDILNRQAAVLELKNKINWRQHFQAATSFAENNGKSILKLGDILEIEESFYKNKYIIFLFKILPVITISLLIMSFTFDLFGNYISYVAVLAQLVLLLPGAKNRFNVLNKVYGIKNSLMAYEKSISMICSEKFTSTYLNSLKGVLSKSSAGKEISDLNRISENISQRKNILFIFLNIFLLWDYQCMFAFEKWKLKNGTSIYDWIQVVGEFEMLNSLSLIAFDHSDWTVPEILDTPLVFKADFMAHPLLGEKAVCNDLTLKKPSTIVLITGSNMSGKSTLLRTAGINLVLAYSGAPVCAKKFSCSIMNIYTCMRISDNLEKNISSFYGEILRIKEIVKACKRKEQVFFLLDEIFKGTNSMDRHLGAKILIKNLESSTTCGMVSTHDLELAEMESESSGRIKNYHFKEYYENGKIRFDYKLRNGVSNTRNALYLMKMAGIDIGESPEQ